MDSNLVIRGCGFESRLRLELSPTEVRPLSKAPNPQLLPARRSVGWPLLQVCVYLDGLNAEHKFTAVYTLYNCVYDKYNLFFLVWSVGGRGQRSRCVCTWMG